MINSKEFDSIRKYLGAFYSPKIIEYLNKKNILNSNNESYSDASIRKIAKGKQENLQVEKEIFALIAKTKKTAEKELLKREQIISQ